MLRKNFFSCAELAAIASDFRTAGLADEEVALMAFAQKIASQRAAVTEEDYQQLHAFGLSDKEILDVILACTARTFFSKTLDALAMEPDQVYTEFEPELRELLVIGRPFPSE